MHHLAERPTKEPENSVRWVRQWPNDSHPEFRIGRIGEDVIAEWVGFATLQANREGTRTEFRIADGNNDPLISEKFHRGLVQGLVRHLKGGLTLHGSSVSVHGRGILLTGPSGVGKSSLTAALCTHCSAEFVADDTAIVEVDQDGVRLVPVEVHHWLDVETAEALGLQGTDSRWKRAIAPRRKAAAAQPLLVIVNLRFDDRLVASSLKRLTGRKVFEALSMSTLRFVIDERVVVLHDFDQLAKVAARVPVFDLTRPRSVDGLTADTQTIVELMTRLSQAGEHRQ